MATEAQIEANRLNAQKSTGPKSAAGKETVARNAVTHGFYCQHLILPGEDEAALQELRRAFYARLDPQDALEEMYAERAVMAAWRMRRFIAYEQYQTTRNRENATRFVPWSSNLKHIAACERAMDKAIRELHQLRKIHPTASQNENRENKPNSASESGTPASAGASSTAAKPQAGSMRVEIVKTNPIAARPEKNPDAFQHETRDTSEFHEDSSRQTSGNGDAEVIERG